MKLFGLEIRKAALRRIDAPLNLVWSPNGFVISDAKTATLLKEGFACNSTIYGMIMTMYSKFASIPWILYKVKAGKQSKARQYKTLTGAYSDKGWLDTLRLKANAF